jgi:hypothetical protein
MRERERKAGRIKEAESLRSRDAEIQGERRERVKQREIETERRKK